MIWLLGLILFTVELYVLLHTTYCRWEGISMYKYRTYDYDNKLDIRVWHILLLLLGNIWWLSLVTALIFLIIYLSKWSNPSDCSETAGTIWSLSIDNCITRFLSKEISN